MKEMVTENCHLSLRKIDAELSVSHESIELNETRCCSTSSERPFHKVIIVDEFLAKNSTNFIK